MADEFEQTSTKYQLNLIYLLDTSGSMCGAPIQQLNVAMAEAVQIAEETAKQKEVQLFMRVVEFNSVANWLYGDTRTGVDHIDWVPLNANGGTDTAGAIDLTCGVMHRDILGERNYKPVVILITDGESNSPNDTIAAIGRLKSSLKSSTDPNKDKIIRIAIGVEGANQNELQSFASIGNIVREDGSIDEGVPFVFDVNNIDLLKSLLKGITVSSIASSIGGGAVDGGEDDAPTVNPTPGSEEDKDWAD